VAADLAAVRDFLRRDPALALRNGGPFDWPALMYVTYARVPSGFTAVTGAIGEGERGPIACIAHPCADQLVKLLLDAGANPNQSQALYNTMFTDRLGKWPAIFVQYGLNAGDRANWNPDDQEPIFDFLLSQVVSQGRLARRASRPTR
jgi:hypothetical protein